MHQDYTKICRVCMSDGSRDIFHRPSQALDGTAAGAVKLVSPLERLLEKLRYVTMMKIEENDDLPRLLCDLCIVQLNVAYNFKRQAVENDTKLRQYFIENGISSNQAMMMNEAPSRRSSFTASNMSQSQQHRRFPIVPLIVKTEPSDVDAFSDVTTETNIELDRNRFQSVASTTVNSSPEDATQRSNNSMYTNERSQSSMVYVNSGYEFNSVTPSSDIEFVQNYHMNANKDDHENISGPPLNTSKASGNVSSNTNNSSPKSPNRTSTSPIRREIQTNNSSRNDKSHSRTRRKKGTEIDNLSINMVPSIVKTNLPKEHRRTLGKTSRVRPEDDKHASEGRPPKRQHSTFSSSNPLSANSFSSSKSLQSNGDRRYKVKTLGTPPAKEIHISKSKRVTQKLVLVNPFNTAKNNSNSKGVRKSDQITKKRTPSKLHRPKIEPPSVKKN